MKKRFITMLLMIYCFCFMTNISIKAYGFSNFENYSFSGNECHLYLEHDNYLVTDEIDLTIYTSFINIVDDFIIVEEGFYLNSNIQIVDNKIQFSVYYNGIYSDPYLKLTILFENGETNYVQLFGYINQNEVYLNQYSYQEAIEVYNYYKN